MKLVKNMMTKKLTSVELYSGEGCKGGYVTSGTGCNYGSGNGGGCNTGGTGSGGMCR